MRLTIFATLIAAVAATPIGEIPQLLGRATCSSLAYHNINVNGQVVSVKGPFKISANAPGSNLNGNYAHAGSPNFVPFFVFGVTPAQAAKRASHFYLASDATLITVQNNAIYTAYEQGPTDTAGTYVSIGTSDQVRQDAKVYCAIDGASCALNCGLWNLTYSCLGSPKFQPDWLITSTAEASKPGCVKFTPRVVPG